LRYGKRRSLVARKVVFGELIEMGLSACGLTTKRQVNLLLDLMGRYFGIAGLGREVMALWCT
jgi:hypothetical protein